MGHALPPSPTFAQEEPCLLQLKERVERGGRRGTGGQGTLPSIPVHSSSKDGEGKLPMGCESGLNFNH